MREDVPCSDESLRTKVRSVEKFFGYGLFGLLVVAAAPFYLGPLWGPLVGALDAAMTLAAKDPVKAHVATALLSFVGIFWFVQTLVYLNAENKRQFYLRIFLCGLFFSAYLTFFAIRPAFDFDDFQVFFLSYVSAPDWLISIPVLIVMVLAYGPVIALGLMGSSLLLYAWFCFLRM